ncbi:MAG: IS5 family transposase [Microcoleus sp. PH2017_29_MFU_D_A]|uniref:IS5 family transposase n=1 Tax=unclassified Microcoleus TaxID=2642155 RepID=UPI001D686A6C|nr:MULTISPECIES: IS5 family transposase [unclassified Microcoleus]MCC3416382.1 IS5 family transposase [Microcoleus sp. PH2017_07_MST_O_A]MCC3432974.1 IS5 family transposase [Microcoleus sp. PH2017_04_SCI_O_A]MCC3511507.1 IS5 family transposase [Microcoleus sp. PH2017_17_BER_D_A]TAE55282.1 MAG: IS5 family transposase [Oscillatoriales cyanobacterium]MCC3409454.1 IS5 family transposase [Microcoleus sp. PH2017_10_PVI_O_A]
MNYEQLQKSTPKDFKRYCGVHQETFKEMVKIVKAEKIFQKKSGRPSKLCSEDQILMTLSYLREYPTFFHLGIKWGISESNADRIVIRTEKALIRSGLFNLPGKKILYQSNNEIKTVVLDVSEHEIERPQKKQKKYYSGKQKYHTIKSQVLANPKSAEIICTAFGDGKTHDFSLFKKSKIGINQNLELLGDKGYQGITKIHTNSRTPFKKNKNKKLSQAEKQFNRQLAKSRIIMENIHRSLKIFRILSSRYRNRRRRFGLRFNLIAGIYNYELSLKTN